MGCILIQSTIIILNQTFNFENIYLQIMAYELNM